MLRWLAVGVVLVGLIARAQTVAFRSDVNLRSVHVQVTDSQGRVAKGLQREDFELREGGAVQRIAFFQEQGQPLSLGILADASGSMLAGQKLQHAKQALESLVSALPGDSEVFYAEFTNRLGNFVELKQGDGCVPDANITPAASRSGTALYDAIAMSLCRLQNARYTRRALVVITDGADQHSRLRLSQLIGLLRGTDTRVYLIGAFTSGEYDLYRSQGESLMLVTGRSIDNPLRAFGLLARESGAESYFPITDAQLKRAVEAITQELQTSYTLGYYVQPASSPARQVEVTVRGARLHVKTRQGFSTEPGGVHFRADTCEISPAEHPYPFESKLRRQDGVLVYHEDFADPRSGWPSRESSWYGRGEYHMVGQQGSEQGTIAAYGPSWDHFRASVEVKQSAVPVRDIRTATLPAAGLIFRLTDLGYYALIVTRFGGAVQAKVIANHFRGSAEDLTSWVAVTESGTARSAEWTKLGVDVLEGEALLFVNGLRIARVRDSTFTTGHVGMAQFGPGHAVFRELVVEEMR